MALQHLEKITETSNKMLKILEFYETTINKIITENYFEKSGSISVEFADILVKCEGTKVKTVPTSASSSSATSVTPVTPVTSSSSSSSSSSFSSSSSSPPQGLLEEKDITVDILKKYLNDNNINYKNMRYDDGDELQELVEQINKELTKKNITNINVNTYTLYNIYKALQTALIS